MGQEARVAKVIRPQSNPSPLYPNRLPDPEPLTIQSMTQSSVLVRLKQPVPSLGSSGQVARVQFGYARNFLIPRGLAELATGRAAAGQLAHQPSSPITVNDHDDVRTVAASLNGQTVTIDRAANADGTLFASLHAEDVATALKTDPIFRMQPIKQTGEHQITLDFGHDIVAAVSVKVRSTRPARKL